jgi:hypothetical protein
MKTMAIVLGITVAAFVLSAVAEAETCTIPNTPGTGGSCELTCPANTSFASVSMSGIGRTLAQLVCGPKALSCGGGGLLAPPATTPLQAEDLGFGCQATEEAPAGDFVGACTCSAVASPGIVTSATCECD